MTELERGSEGPEVAELQEKLTALGLKPGEVDGVFGVITESAVKMFQGGASLEADGIVDDEALERLTEMVAAENESKAG